MTPGFEGSFWLRVWWVCPRCWLTSRMNMNQLYSYTFTFHWERGKSALTAPSGHLHHFYLSRWSFQIFFMFTSTWGNDPNLTNIFQLGWNHQLVNIVAPIFLWQNSKHTLLIVIKKIWVGMAWKRRVTYHVAELPRASKQPSSTAEPSNILLACGHLFGGQKIGNIMR